MKYSLAHYLFLPLGIILVVFPSACVGKLEPAGTGPPVQWYKTFGGEFDDQGRSVQQTADGGYIVCGMTESYGAGVEDVWLLKTDAEGNKLWEKVFGGEELAVANSVWQTMDGGYIVCGETGSYQIDKTKAWLIRTNVEGNKLWDKRFRYEELVFGNSVLQTTDGGYIVCGTRTTGSLQTGKTGALVIKADANGNKVWDKTFEGEWAAESFSIQQTTDGGYIVCGNAKSCEGCRNRVLLLKIAPE